MGCPDEGYVGHTAFARDQRGQRIIADDSCRDRLIELKVRQRLHQYAAMIFQSIPGAAQL